MDSNLSGDFRLAQAFAQQIDGGHPALLERIEISSYSGWISHSRKYNELSLCYATFNNPRSRLFDPDRNPLVEDAKRTL